MASIASILIGGYWDISWHMTVGRDSFWTPAHVAIQLGGIIAGSGGAYQIISTTLRRDHSDGVRVWGFRGLTAPGSKARNEYGALAISKVQGDRTTLVAARKRWSVEVTLREIVMVFSRSR